MSSIGLVWLTVSPSLPHGTWPSPVLSTTEAEYMAAVQAGKEIKWMRNLMLELGIPLPGASSLLIDNQSAISVVKNPENHGRMKQLDLCYYWLRDAVQEQAITPSFVPTTQQAADADQTVDYTQGEGVLSDAGTWWICGESLICRDAQSGGTVDRHEPGMQDSHPRSLWKGQIHPTSQ